MVIVVLWRYQHAMRGRQHVENKHTLSDRHHLWSASRIAQEDSSGMLEVMAGGSSSKACITFGTGLTISLHFKISADYTYSAVIHALLDTHFVLYTNICVPLCIYVYIHVYILI